MGFFELGPVGDAYRGERIKGRWILKAEGEIAQHMVFWIGSSTCFSIVLMFLIAKLHGQMQYQKAWTHMHVASCPCSYSCKSSSGL